MSITTLEDTGDFTEINIPELEKEEPATLNCDIDVELYNDLKLETKYECTWDRDLWSDKEKGYRYTCPVSNVDHCIDIFSDEEINFNGKKIIHCNMNNFCHFIKKPNESFKCIYDKFLYERVSDIEKAKDESLMQEHCSKINEEQYVCFPPKDFLKEENINKLYSRADHFCHTFVSDKIRNEYFNCERNICSFNHVFCKSTLTEEECKKDGTCITLNDGSWHPFSKNGLSTYGHNDMDCTYISQPNLEVYVKQCLNKYKNLFSGDTSEFLDFSSPKNNQGFFRQCWDCAKFENNTMEKCINRVLTNSIRDKNLIVPKSDEEACECLDNWTFKDEVYIGCDSRMPGETKPWCYVDPQCKESRRSGSGKPWKYCSLGENPCKCKDEWKYEGEWYQGCDTRQPGNKEKPWCFVYSSKCPEAIVPTEKDKAISNIKKPWKFCQPKQEDPCNCENEWTYKDNFFRRCKDWEKLLEVDKIDKESFNTKDHVWCVVDQTCATTEKTNKEGQKIKSCLWGGVACSQNSDCGSNICKTYCCKEELFDPNCAKCNEKGECESCIAGYKLVPGKGCINMFQNTCRNGTAAVPATKYGEECTRCNEGFVLKDQHCVAKQTFYHVEGNGEGYLGHLNVTQSGKPCQGWNSQYPHKHTWYDMGEKLFPEYDAADFPEGFSSLSYLQNPLFMVYEKINYNHCRNPDGKETIWCYTKDPLVPWEFCSPTNAEAIITNNKPEPWYFDSTGTKINLSRQYRGTLNETISGKKCAKWNRFQNTDLTTLPTNDIYMAMVRKIHKDWSNISAGYDENRFPIISWDAIGDHDYCRNPDGKKTLWCFTDDPETPWEYCNIVDAMYPDKNFMKIEDKLCTTSNKDRQASWSRFYKNRKFETSAEDCLKYCTDNEKCFGITYLDEKEECVECVHEKEDNDSSPIWIHSLNKTAYVKIPQEDSPLYENIMKTIKDDALLQILNSNKEPTIERESIYSEDGKKTFCYFDKKLETFLRNIYTNENNHINLNLCEKDDENNLVCKFSKEKYATCSDIFTADMDDLDIKDLTDISKIKNAVKCNGSFCALNNWYKDLIPESIIRHMDPCQCNPEWLYEGETYFGCDKRKPDEPEPWCYVVSDTCKEGTNAEESSAGRAWKYCDVDDDDDDAINPCDCFEEWHYNGELYYGCDFGSPDEPRPWCYVSPSCDTARDSFHANMKWKYCEIKNFDPCKCKTTWSYDHGNGKEPYFRCDPRKPDHTKPWCSVYPSCDVDQYKGFKINNPGTKTAWRECNVNVGTINFDPCKCKGSWLYDSGSGKEQYYRCDPRKPDDIKPWCFVYPSCDVDQYEGFEIHNAGTNTAWRECNV